MVFAQYIIVEEDKNINYVYVIQLSSKREDEIQILVPMEWDKNSYNWYMGKS